MEAVAVAVIGVIGATIVAFIEAGRRTSKIRWDENKTEHAFVVEKIEHLGTTLGISIDRVEKGVERTEAKVDEHIRDHAKGEV